MQRQRTNSDPLRAIASNNDGFRNYATSTQAGGHQFEDGSGIEIDEILKQRKCCYNVNDYFHCEVSSFHINVTYVILKFCHLARDFHELGWGPPATFMANVKTSYVQKVLSYR